MRARALEVRAADGRRIDVRVAGEHGVPLVLHHGTAGADTQFEPWVDAALSRELRCVTYSRPGYGSSDRARARTVGDCAGDVARILDEIGAETCLTIGPSGGGPHALALAAFLPARVIACATVGGLAPFDANGLDWFADMGRALVATYSLAAAGDDAGLIGWIDAYARGLVAGPSPALFDSQMPLAAVDVAALEGEYGRYLLADTQEALRNGGWGWFDDAKAFTRPWGFDVGSITIPVTVWQGAQDRLVPPAHAQWLAAHVPGARLEIRPTDGHMSMGVDGFVEILASVAT